MNELNDLTTTSQNEEIASLRAENAELKKAFKRSMQLTVVVYGAFFALSVTLLLLSVLLNPSTLHMFFLSFIVMWSYMFVVGFLFAGNLMRPINLKSVFPTRQGLALIFWSFLLGLLFVLAALLFVTIFTTILTSVFSKPS